MYRIGFGDCFLVSLPLAKDSNSTDEVAHILVDCGVHARGGIGTIEKIVNDIAQVTGKKLAILIASHAHQDHIAGYDKYGDKFSTFEIGEVWLPWTWDKSNPQAVKLQKNQLALTNALAQHFSALAVAGDEPSAAAKALENIHGNQHAIALLNQGFGVTQKVYYRKAGDNADSPGNISGLTVRFLGPPQSQEFLAMMDPPPDQRYSKLNATGEIEAANAVKPFAGKWQIDRNDPALKELVMTKEEEAELNQVADAPLDGAAFALDQALNNESVVALMVYRGQYLLFPGDAQYGNWKNWLGQQDSADILSRITFFKVAHHGSINATPKGIIEKMTEGKFGAMVSTQSTPWPSIPLNSIMQGFDQKAQTRLFRSDWIDIDKAPTPAPGAQPTKPAQPPKGFTVGPFWVDYLIQI